MSGWTETTASKHVAHMTLRAACAGLRVFFRHAPGRWGKQWLWERVVEPHILSRRLPIEASTRFGARLEGSFPDPAHGVVYFFGTWQPAITALFRDALRPGDVAIDVGAGAGLHSLLAARLVGPAGRVHAIEPSPGVFARLRRNLQANGAFQVIPHNVAATDAPTRLPLYLAEEAPAAGTGRPVLEAMVNGRPLPQIVPTEDLLAARLIRIAVKGGEWRVLLGLAPWLAHLRPDAEMLVEVRRAELEASGSSVPAVVELFASAGYGAQVLRQEPGGAACLDEAVPPPEPLEDLQFERAGLLFRRSVQAQ
jgi:FkbM family methyltransferase